LVELSAVTNVSISEWIRRGIDLRLEAEGVSPEVVTRLVPVEGAGL
jgi:hypothetical protein